MDDPIQIPAFHGHIDLLTASRLVTTSGKNPFIRQVLSYNDFKLNEKLKTEIESFVAKLKLALEQKTADLACESKATPKTFSPSLAPDSPLMIANREHEKLLARISSVETKGHQLFLKSLAERNYSQALRRICTSTSPIGFNLFKILLEFREKIKLDINDLNNDKRNALHIAAIYKNNAAFQLLKSIGADDKIQDLTGKTAADYALENDLSSTDIQPRH